MTLNEARRRVGISPNRLQELLESGLVNGTKTGKSWEISYETVRRLQAHRNIAIDTFGYNYYPHLIESLKQQKEKRS